MDNYKIKVKDEAESKEAQELFVQLGFEKTGFSCDVYPCYLATWGGGFSDYDLDSLNVSRDRKELTLPQLRDLVVLMRNDINDATHFDPKGSGNARAVYLCGDWHFYNFTDKEWDPSSEVMYAEDRIARLKPIHPHLEKEEGLISGAEAKLAWANGEIVEFRDGFDKWYEDWTDLNSKKNGFWITDFDLPHHQFRIKPTLTVNAELPKPAREFQLNTEVYAVTYEFKTREERNAFADKLRGTNS